MKKKLLFLVVFALLWGGVATVQAETYSGECGAEGANLTWTLDTETGKLEISGTGAMKDYDYSSVSNCAPWYNYCSSITSVTIGEDVTAIGECAFYGCTGLTSITIPNSVTAIGYGAFYHCTRLTEITIPPSIQTIDDGAFSRCSGLTEVWFNADSCISGGFRGCSALTTVHIGDNVKWIPKNAFFECTGLSEITIPPSVIAIGEKAFYGCTGLTEVTIPESVTAIDEYAFFECTGLSEITIPPSVQTIDIYAFSRCKNLTSVTIGNGVTAIGDWAFDGCTNLTSVTIGKSVLAIGSCAFSCCDSLTSITIPNSVITIGDWAFGGCTSLTEVWFNADSCISIGYYWCETLALTTVHIGENVKQIPDGTFSGCKSLETFEGKFATDDERCLVINDTLRFFAPSNLVEYSIPDDVKVIDGSAFNGCSDLALVTIPPSVISIGINAFYGCTGLNEVWFNADSCVSGGFSGCSALATVHIGDNVKWIPKNAFSDCKNLTSVTIGNGVTAIGNGAFYRCTGLKKFEGKFASTDNRCLVVRDTLVAFAPSGLSEYTIPDGVTTIGEHAFYDCPDLISVTIPNSVTAIGYGAFLGCTGLTEVWFNADSCISGGFRGCSALATVHIGENVKRIPELAFFRCSGLTEVWFNADSCISGGFRGCSALATVHIGENVKRIPDNAFSECSGLNEITIPESVTAIGNGAFYRCTGLKKFEGKFASTDNRCLVVRDTLVAFAPSGLPEYTIPDDVTTIGNNAFDGCTDLTSVTIGNGVISIDDYAFSDCTRLTSVTILESVTAIGSHAFYYCSGLTSVTIPNSVTAIGDNAFSWCDGLTSVTIPESVTTIGKSAFSGCKSLTSVTIPENVTSIGNGAFSYCNGLTSVTAYNLTPVNIDEKSVFYYVNYDNCTLYVPAESVELYKAAEGWKEFKILSIKKPVVQDFKPTGITPEDGSVVTELKTFTLEFAETPALAAEAQPITLAGKDTLLTATLAAGEGNTLEITLADTLKVASEYTLTIPEGSFGDADFADDPAFGHCNPALTYTYTVKEPVVQDFMPTGITPADNSEVEALKTFTLEFTEMPSLAAEAQPITLAGKDTLLTATLAAGEGNTLEITLADTLKVAGTYTLTIPEGSFGDALFASDPTTGHCNPVLTYTYTVKEPVVQDFKPTGITPADSSEVEALKTFTLEFAEAPSLAAEAKPITLAGKDTLLTATLAAGEGNTLEITLADTLKVAGEYTLTIPEGSFGDALFASNPTTGHCNPELTYTYTVKAPEPVEPDEPDEPSSITEMTTDAGHITVYNLQGVLVLETDDAAALKTLQNGAYIVNGKKMIIVR